VPHKPGWRKELTAEQRRDMLARERERGARRRRAAGIPQTSAADRSKLALAARWGDHVRSDAGRAPSEIRSLHSMADRNSQLVRRYPTVAALDAGWAAGELRSPFTRDAAMAARRRLVA
jgi:hypothetical protein